MNLKLGKSLPLLKFKPSVLQPLILDSLTSEVSNFNINKPIHNFDDLIKIDCQLGLAISKIRRCIQQYLSSVKQNNIPRLNNSRSQLKNSLQSILQIFQKLEFQNIEKDISSLFKAPYGIYDLYRYVWNPDILHLLHRIKSTFQQKKPKQVIPQISCSQKISLKYIETIQQIVNKQAKFLLKQFTTQMFIVPENWGLKIIKQLNPKQKIHDILNKAETNIENNYEIQNHMVKQSILAELLSLYNSKQSDQIDNFKEIFNTLFYFDIQNQFYSYLSYLKTLLLNKTSGIFNGDYQVWEQVYNICLKIYSRKEQLRGKKGIQIDQILQNQIEDPQFTNFILNSNIEDIALSTINFYFKNCPKSVQNSIRPVILSKIQSICKKNQFSQYQDIVQYLDTQALQKEKDQIIQCLKNSIHSLLNSNSDNLNYFYFHKAISEVVEYLIKNQSKFFLIFNEDLIQKMQLVLQKEKDANKKIKDDHIAYFIYSLLNTTFIQSYEQQVNFDSYLVTKPGQKFSKLMQKLIVSLKDHYNLQLHQDAYAVIQQWKKLKIQIDSDSQQQKQKELQKQTDVCELQIQENINEHIALIMVLSGRDCQFKLQSYFVSQQKKQSIANHITKIFKRLSQIQFEQRRQIQNYLCNKRSEIYVKNRQVVQSYLCIKGFKDRVLHENIMNLSVKIHPVISFAEVAQFGIEFLSFTSPLMIDQPLPLDSDQEYGTIDPFDVCDIISGEQPIQCLKLIYKKIGEFDQAFFDFDSLKKLPTPLVKHLGNLSNIRCSLVSQLVNLQEQLTISIVDRIQDFKKFLFYVQLMNKVFGKLNQKSQKGIKQIKIIFAAMEKICLKVWQSVSCKVISSQLYSICQSSQIFQQNIIQINRFQSHNTNLCDKSVQLSQITFNKLVKTIKLPFIDSVLYQDNHISKTCQQLLCFSIGKVLHPQNLPIQYQKLFNPLQPMKIQLISQKSNRYSSHFKQNYQIISQIVKTLSMIQFTCSNQQYFQSKNKQQQKQWSGKWRLNCIQVIQSLLKVINSSEQKLKPQFKREARSKSLWISVLLVHLKAQIIKILVPYLIKEPLKNPISNPKTYNNQLEQTFTIFTLLCQVIQKISPGQQDHLMTFLQIFEGFDIRSQKNILPNSKLSQFLIKAVQSLLDLVFKGIRVRSYHFYKFIKSYLKISKEKSQYHFFNSVISYYIQTLMKQIVPSYKLPQNIISYCDQNMNSNMKNTNLKEISNKESIINENSLKKSVSKIRFNKFIRFQSKFQYSAQKICVISMFLNLFCRLNFKTLTQGIQKIWQGHQMHLTYIQYLQRIANLVSKQSNIPDKKNFDIINVDCYGNLSIILREPFIKLFNNSKFSGRDQGSKLQYFQKMIFQILRLIQEVLRNNTSDKIKNALTIPVKKILSQIKNSSTPIEIIDYITQSIQDLNLSNSLYNSEQKQSVQLQSTSKPFCPEILDMILTCYNTKLARGISSNVHIQNLLFVCRDSELKLRVLENNMNSLERRMSRKEIRAALAKYAMKDEPIVKAKNRRSSICKKAKLSSPTDPLYQQVLFDNKYSITKNSQQLIIKIIDKFVDSYKTLFNSHNKQLQKQNSYQTLTLFNNLKILSLVALNNPQVIGYLLRYSRNGMSVYDVMIDAGCRSLPVFVELYLIFMKTNFGFYLYQTKQQDTSEILPLNFQIEQQIKQALLKRIFDQNNQNSTKQPSCLLKSMLFLTKLSTQNNRPSFRCYKFGNIVNNSYTQIYRKWEINYFERVVEAVKLSISQGIHDRHGLEILTLYDQILTILLKQSDLNWMKLNLDIALKQAPKPYTKTSFNTKQPSPQSPSQQKEPPSPTIAQINRQSSPMLSYSFQYEVMNQQIYSILQKINNQDKTIAGNRCQVQMLQKMMEYSAKQTVWDGLIDQDGIFRNYPTSRSGQGSFGLTNSHSNDSNNDINMINPYPNNHPTAATTNSQTIANNPRPLQQSDQILPSNNNLSEPEIQQTASTTIIQTSQSLEIEAMSCADSCGNVNRISTGRGRMVEMECEGDGIVEDGIVEDGIVEDGDYVIEDDGQINVDQFTQIMSQTSLQFLSQHSVKILQPELDKATSGEQPNQLLQQEAPQPTKQVLQSLYQQSCINPEAKKQLLRAIGQANVLELEKFISKESVDEEIEIIVVRELWARGIMPSATSINRNNRYYNSIYPQQNTIPNVSIMNLNSSNSPTLCNQHIAQSIIYKRMYQNYSKNLEASSTEKYVPELNSDALENIVLISFAQGRPRVWAILHKLCLSPGNFYRLLTVCLRIFSFSENQLHTKINKIYLSDNKQQATYSIKKLKILIINDIFAGCIKNKIGLRLLLTGYWDCQKYQIISGDNFDGNQQQECTTNQKLSQKKVIIPILEYILKQSCIIDEIISIRDTKVTQNTSETNIFIHILWQYFKNCDQYRIHSKLEQNINKKLSKQERTTYPYYQIQESLTLSDNIVRKLMDKLFGVKKIVGRGKAEKVQQSSLTEELYMILVYLDPMSFQKYMQFIIQKISTRISQIIKKQQKILASFQSSWQPQSTESPTSQLLKQQKYWQFHQSKQSFQSTCQQDLQYFRNLLVDLSINLLPRFKKIRFDYHYGTSYRNWKMEIQVLKEKMLTSGSVDGLVELEAKSRELEDWRRAMCNHIIYEEIVPIVEACCQKFVPVLIQAQMFISQFVNTFQLQQHDQKMVIYNTCSKLYQIMLASQILTHEQKPTFHSMSKLKTSQSIQSLNNVNTNGNQMRRKSTIQQAGRKSVRISINSCLPKVESLLKKIGSSCTFLNLYIGPEEQLRELHARYSDVNKRLKVLWTNRTTNHTDNKPEKQKVIQCRRNHIIQDTLSQIDQQFISLPIKIKFQGEIGIDYGGVTRQWITLFMKQILNPTLGLFTLSANKLTFQPNRNSKIIPNHLKYFKKIGILVGKAMKQNWLLQINLTKSFLKHLLGSTLYVQDLEDIDPESAKSLKWILDNDIGFDDDLGLNFTHEVQRLGVKELVELLPGGANIPVTQQNKKNYVKLVAKMKMTQQIRQQSKAFMTGLQSVIPYSTLSLFSYKQISLYLSGMPTIDVKQMKMNAKYEHFTSQSQQIIWFWEILGEWEQQQLANFLFFLTGSYKVPYGGFKQQPIGFNRLLACTDYLPVAHTCFSVIDLSSYSSKQKLGKLLTKSIQEGKGFSVS